ncbi:MAG TPA: phosphatidylglycerophosphatase A [Phycisphaerales bacterium]|nr:phosphatidylglycerophosphatase A [Phycisphaerales bacterium]
MSPLGKRLITTFGLGFMRPAPGTWGSLPPCAAGAALALLGLAGTPVWYAVMAAFAIVFSWACVEFGEGAEAEFGGKDPSQVVADETAGMAVTLMFLPSWCVVIVGSTVRESEWRSKVAVVVTIAVAFVLFRITDILKLPPAHGLQRLKGGWGILVDDLVAGLQAGVFLVAVCWLWHRYS